MRPFVKQTLDSKNLGCVFDEMSYLFSPVSCEYSRIHYTNIYFKNVLP